jgi:trimeric autotransporter adhesin
MKTFIFLSIIILINFNAKSQIFATRSTNESITLTPTGVSSVMSSPTLSSTNTGLGEDALKLATTVMNNTAIGYKALSKVTTLLGQNGSFNTAVGSLALLNNTSGYFNSALGYLALTNNTTGFNNSAMGVSALAANVSGNSNSAFGANALAANTTIGGNSGNSNSAFGYNSLKANTIGTANSAMGQNALGANTTGNSNVAIGSNALSTNLIGGFNVAVGTNALQANTGSSNTAVGMNALTVNQGAINNSAMGHQAMNATTLGHNNVAMGKDALLGNVIGSYNVALGTGALSTIAGNQNVGIGYNAGALETGSSKLYIDNSSTVSPLIGGDFANNKVGINRNMTTTGVNEFTTRTENFQVEGECFKTLGSGNWIIPSDRRLKTNIVSLDKNRILQKVLKMQGVTYELKANPERGLQYGFIAQDLREIFPEKITENKAGYLSASYGDFDPLIVEAIKALNDKIVKLESENTLLKSLNGRLDALNIQLVKRGTSK